MRAVIQRVHSATVRVAGYPDQFIGQGLLVFLGIAGDDSPADADWLIAKIIALRIFEDDKARMNRDLSDINGELMLISQFTLYGNLRKGTRPSFNHAAPPAQAEPLYQYAITQLTRLLPRPPATGIFGAHMDIEARNNGPVTLIIDSRQRDF